jgi:hypothetical protein
MVSTESTRRKIVVAAHHQTYVDKCSHGTAYCRVLKICILQDDGVRLAAELHQRGLQVLASLSCEYGTDLGAAGEVQLPDGRVSDEGIGDGDGILGLMQNEVQHTVRKASLSQHVGNGPIAARRQFRALKHGSIPSGDRIEYGAETQVVRSIPMEVRRVS